jgi:RimJ/RimL family protein N-acetyltransferase
MSPTSVRPFAQPSDYRAMIDYFHGGSDSFLRGMGVDRKLLPDPEEWFKAVWEDHHRPEWDQNRDRFYVAWEHTDRVVGHSSINRIVPRIRAYAHLHLWEPELRGSGLGTGFFRRSIDLFFHRFELQELFVEPYAHNPDPARVLNKLGFEKMGTYIAVPGPSAFEQEVSLYRLTRAEWKRLLNSQASAQPIDGDES